MTDDEDWTVWFEAAWAYREEIAYPALFGAFEQQIYTLPPTLFLETFKQDSYDPRWLHTGVFQSPPNEKHLSWLYFSSGLSNPWEDDKPDPRGVSGLGSEFVFESTVQGTWAILRLQHLIAFQTLLSCGKYARKELLGYYDRVPLRASLTPDPSNLRWLMIAPPEGYPCTVDTPSGAVDLLAVVAISDAEAQFARERGGDELVSVLKMAGAFPTTNPYRTCTVYPK